MLSWLADASTPLWVVLTTPGAVLSFGTWAFFVKDPPVWVSWREFTSRIDSLVAENKTLREENRQLRSLASGSTTQARRVLALAEELRKAAADDVGEETESIP